MPKYPLKLIISTEWASNDNTSIISSDEDCLNHLFLNPMVFESNASITSIHFKVKEDSDYNAYHLLNYMVHLVNNIDPKLNIISIKFRIGNFNRGYIGIISGIHTLSEISIQCADISNTEFLSLSHFKSLKKLSIDLSRSSQYSKVLQYFASWRWESVLSHLSLRGFEINNIAILNVLKQFPNLTILNLTGSLVTELGAKFLAFANLEELHIDSQLTNSNNLRILSKNIVLKSFRLNYVDLLNSPLISLDTVDNWTKNTSLKELSLCSATLEEGVINTISKMPIKSLSLKEVANFKEEPTPLWRAGINNLANNSHLRELHVGELYLYQFGEISLKRLLNNKNVRYLYLDNPVSSYHEDAKLPDYIITALESLENLELLSLRNVSFGATADETDRNFYLLINSLAKQNSIRHLYLEEIHIDEFPLLLKLTRLESLFIEYIYVRSSSTKIDTSNIELYFQKSAFLQKFECEKITFACNWLKIFKPNKNHFRFDYLSELTPKVSEVLEKNRAQRSSDLQEYLDKYVNLILKCFNKKSYLSYLPHDLIKVIFYNCVTADNLIWKTLEQRLQLIECLIEGILKSVTTETYKSHNIKVVEKYCHGENIFTFHYKTSLLIDAKKHPRDETGITSNIQLDDSMQDIGYSQHTL